MPNYADKQVTALLNRCIRLEYSTPNGTEFEVAEAAFRYANRDRGFTIYSTKEGIVRFYAVLYGVPVFMYYDCEGFDGNPPMTVVVPMAVRDGPFTSFFKMFDQYVTRKNKEMHAEDAFYHDLQYLFNDMFFGLKLKRPFSKNILTRSDDACFFELVNTKEFHANIDTIKKRAAAAEIKHGR